MKSRAISKGTIFRCEGKYPYEDIVDFMLVEDPNSDNGFSSIVATRQKVGLPLVFLPAEARDSNFARISSRWIIGIWKTWIYELGPDEVVFTKCYRIKGTEND